MKKKIKAHLLSRILMKLYCDIYLKEKEHLQTLCVKNVLSKQKQNLSIYVYIQ